MRAATETMRELHGRELSSDLVQVRRITDLRDRAPVAEAGGPVVVSVDSGVIVPGVPEAARVVRRKVHMIAALPPSEARVVVDLSNELFVNAIRYTCSSEPGGTITVVVIRFTDRTQVKVIDEGPRGATTPHIRPSDPMRVDGRGLRWVADEASRWGVVSEPGRTVVWFEVDRPGRGD